MVEIESNSQCNLEVIWFTWKVCPLSIPVLDILWLVRWTLLSRETNEPRVNPSARCHQRFYCAWV